MNLCRPTIWTQSTTISHLNFYWVGYLLCHAYLSWTCITFLGASKGLMSCLGLLSLSSSFPFRFFTFIGAIQTLSLFFWHARNLMLTAVFSSLINHCKELGPFLFQMLNKRQKILQKIFILDKKNLPHFLFKTIQFYINY